LADLNFLDMSNNLLTEVPERAFRKALELTILILSHNKISVIQRQAFKGCLLESYVFVFL